MPIRPVPLLFRPQGLDVGAVPLVAGTQPSDRPPSIKTVVLQSLSRLPFDWVKLPSRKYSRALVVVAPSEHGAIAGVAGSQMLDPTQKPLPWPMSMAFPEGD